MANKKLDIIEVRRILRLNNAGYSNRFIAEVLGISRNTVITYINLFHMSGHTNEEISKFDDYFLDVVINRPVLRKDF